MHTKRLIFISAAAAAISVVSLPSAAHAEANAMAVPEVLTNASNTWKNQSGSTMTISFNAASQPGVYTVTGSYINNASGFGCQGTSYPLNGVFYAGNSTIAFSVAWSNAYADCASVTGWTGYYSPADGAIHTDWNLSYQNGSGQMVIQSGSDQFTPASAMKLSSPFAQPVE